VFVAFLDAYVVVALVDVEFGEYNSSAEVVNEVSDEWEGVLVTNRPFIDFPIVLYWSQFSILLFDEEEG
jgi:hypothetical protein